MAKESKTEDISIGRARQIVKEVLAFVERMDKVLDVAAVAETRRHDLLREIETLVTQVAEATQHSLIQQKAAEEAFGQQKAILEGELERMRFGMTTEQTRGEAIKERLSEEVAELKRQRQELIDSIPAAKAEHDKTLVGLERERRETQAVIEKLKSELRSIHSRLKV